MAVETATYIDDLVQTNPSRADWLHQGDNHLTLLKYVLQNTFVNADKEYDLEAMFNNLVPAGAIFAFYDASAIPTGYGVADGTLYDRQDGSGTIQSPDLRGKFVIAADERTAGDDRDLSHGQSDGAWSSTGSTSTNGSHAHSGNTAYGGLHYHGGGWTGGWAITPQQMPPHNHGGGNHNHGQPSVIQSGGGLQVAQGGNWPLAGLAWSGPLIATEGSGQAHAHPVAQDGNHLHGLSLSASGDHLHSVTLDVEPPRYALVYIMKL